MSYDLTKPESREETYLAKMTNDYSGTLPDPIARVDFYLKKLAEMGGGGGTSVYVTGCNINDDGDLIVTLSDGSTINAGKAKGDTGSQGEKGEPGEDGETPDISNVENTVEALAAGLADSGVVQLGSDAYIYGGSVDESKTNVYYRKIGSFVALWGVIGWTTTPVSSAFIQVPEVIRPHSLVVVPAMCNSFDFMASSYSLSTSGILGNVSGSGTLDYSTDLVYFSVTYSTNDSVSGISSLMAALQDLVEV